MNLSQEPPSPGWLKLNTNGSIFSPGLTTVGGVLRDEAGRWVFGFANKQGHCDVILAGPEVVAIGLKLCSTKGLLSIEHNIDSFMAFALMANQSEAQVKYYNVLFACRDMICTLHRMRCYPRKHNQVAAVTAAHARIRRCRSNFLSNLLILSLSYQIKICVLIVCIKMLNLQQIWQQDTYRMQGILVM